MNTIKIDYRHVFCDCGGIVYGHDDGYFMCARCGKLWPVHNLKYDRLLINDKTGWIFPVLDRKETERSHDLY